MHVLLQFCSFVILIHTALSEKKFHLSTKLTPNYSNQKLKGYSITFATGLTLHDTMCGDYF